MVGSIQPAARCIVAAASLVALFVLAPSAVLSQSAADGAARPSALVSAVERLRSEVASDHLSAFHDIGSPEIAEIVAAWDAAVWEGVDPRIAWSYFLGTSPAVVGAAESDRPITAFYHPWTDVALLVVWGPDSRIAEIELLAAEVVLSPEAPAPSPEPAWAEGKEFAPIALARQTAAFIHAFEVLFPDDFAGDWRLRLPWLTDEGFAELHRAALTLRLGRGVAMLAALRAPAKEQPASVAHLLAAVERLNTADADELIAEASATPAESRQALRQAPEGALASLATVAAVPGNSTGVVFVVPPKSPDFFAGLLVSGDGPNVRIERIDFVSYRAVAQAFPAGGSR